jgi:hypothetical protein
MPFKIKIRLKFKDTNEIQLDEDTGVGAIEGGVVGVSGGEEEENLSQFSGTKKKKKRVKTSSKSEQYRSNMENK